MLLGHQKQWDFLKRSIASNRVAHAYLFYGPSKIGKKTVALDFIKLLNGQNPDVVPCQTGVTFADTEQNISPDLLLIKPENSKEQIVAKLAIPIEKIRELKSRLFLSAMSSGYKAAIIDDASLMTFDAQGALLKILEEPKGKTVIILLVEHIDQLLPTIVSRCQIVRFHLLERGQIERYLTAKSVSPKKAREISWLSFGKPGLAIDYFKNPQEERFLREKIKDIVQLTKAPLQTRFRYAEKLSKGGENLNKILEIWLNYFRIILLGRVAKLDLPFSLEKNDYPFKSLKKAISSIEQMRFLIASTNINPRLALEILLMQL